jgi:NADPH:quinone reductase-like Zn-dependent oxidoreductase
MQSAVVSSHEFEFTCTDGTPSKMPSWAMNAGVDVILDNVGGPYLGRNVDCLAFDGRLFIIGIQGGIKGELTLNTILLKRLTVTGTSPDNRVPVLVL